MLELLVALTIVEVVLLLAVLAGYLLATLRGLRDIGRLLDQISFGVRAIDTQTARIAPDTDRLEAALGDAVELLGSAAAESPGGGDGGRRGERP